MRWTRPASPWRTDELGKLADPEKKIKLEDEAAAAPPWRSQAFAEGQESSGTGGHVEPQNS